MRREIEMRKAASIGLCAISWLAAGCAENGGPQIDGAGPVIAQSIASGQVDLFSALDPENKGCWGNLMTFQNGQKKDENGEQKNQNPHCEAWTKDTVTIPESDMPPRPLLARAGLYDLLGLHDTRGPNTTAAVKNDRLRLQRAFAGFYLYDTKTAEDRRNRLSERLIMASNQNCGEFLQTLHGVQGATNFALGSLATATAGAGAIVTGADAARSLAGTGAILSGVRAEMNEDFYRNIFSDALSKAIEIRRQDMLADIRKQYGKPIKDYPAEAAVADALTYNNQCSLVSGISLISTSVNLAADPAGMRTLDAAFRKAGFTPTVSVALTKSYDGDTTAGVGTPKPSAVKGEALIDSKLIDEEVKQILSFATNMKAQIGTKISDNAKKQAATSAITAASKIFETPPPATQPPTPAPGDTVQSIKDQIAALAKTYTSLSDLYTTAVTQNDSASADRIDRLMAANDVQASTLMRIFRDYVSEAHDSIVKAADDAK
jgi:hypothetical protein